MITAEDWIALLRLKPHPEGGYFAESYRSTESIAPDALPERFGGARVVSTAIYFLLRHGTVSHLHRIKSDELWHFYGGQPLTVHVISPEGVYTKLRLGQDPNQGHHFQVMVPAGCWFGATPCTTDTRGYSLVGCTVAPGFDFADFELAERMALLKAYPAHDHIILRLTPPPR